ncbi:MAG: hypothetical protein ACYCS7_02430 [Acidimicrobiales bacterium]
MRLVVRVLALAGTVGTTVRHPPVRLHPSSIRIGETPEEVVRRFREQLEIGGEVVAAGDGHIVARFVGRAGIFRYRTVELVSFGPDGVAFEHLQGPFRDCHERFRAEPVEGGGSVVTHEGSFTMRWGLLGWLLGATIVRGTFEDHVAAHMAESLAPALS